MKHRPFLPSPIAFVSAVLTFVLLGFFFAAAAVVLPPLFELMKTSPRLALIGFLGFMISPAIATVLVHHVGHRALDRIDTDFDARDPARRNRGGIFPKVGSWWAGVLAWMTLYTTSIFAKIVLRVIFPPEPQPDSFALDYVSITDYVSEMSRVVSLSNVASLHTGIWIVIAAWIYELERRASRCRKKHDV